MFDCLLPDQAAEPSPRATLIFLPAAKHLVFRRSERRRLPASRSLHRRCSRHCTQGVSQRSTVYSRIRLCPALAPARPDFSSRREALSRDRRAGVSSAHLCSRARKAGHRAAMTIAAPPSSGTRNFFGVSFVTRRVNSGSVKNPSILSCPISAIAFSDRLKVFTHLVGESARGCRSDGRE